MFELGKEYSKTEIYDKLLQSRPSAPDVRRIKEKETCYLIADELNNKKLVLDNENGSLKKIFDSMNKNYDILVFYEKGDKCVFLGKELGENIEYCNSRDEIEIEIQDFKYIFDNLSEAFVNFDVVYAKVCTAYITRKGVEFISENVKGEVEIVFGESADDQDFSSSEFENVEINQYSGESTLHSKFMILDFDSWIQKIALIGSSNLTAGGIYANRECNVLIRKNGAISFLESKFNDMYHMSKTLEYVKSADSTVENKQILDFSTGEYKEKFGERLKIHTGKVRNELLSAIESFYSKVSSEGEVSSYKMTAHDYIEANENEQEQIRIIDEALKNELPDHLDKSSRSFRETFDFIRRQEIKVEFDKNKGPHGKYVLSFADRFDTSSLDFENSRFKRLVDHLQKVSGDSRIINSISEDEFRVVVNKSRYPEFKGMDVKQEIREFDRIGFRVRKPAHTETQGQDLWDDDNSLELMSYQRDWFERFVGIDDREDEPASQYEIEGPCASGKTLAAVRIIADIKDNILILCPNDTVCDQWIEEIVEYTNISENRISRLKRDSNDISVTTYHYAWSNRTDRHISDREHRLVVYDESHRLRGEKWGKLPDIIESKRELGISATPIGYLQDNDKFGFKRMGNNWAEILDEAGGSLIEIPKICYEGTGIKTGGFNEGLENISRKAQKVKCILSEENFSNAIVFTERIENGEILERRLEKSNVVNNPKFVYSETPADEKSEAFAKLSDGNIDCLIATPIADEGISIRSIDLAIISSWKGSSRVQGTQRVGRLMRATDDNSIPKAVYVPVTDSEVETIHTQVSRLESLIPNEKFESIEKVHYID